jgi:pyruvate,water dikinase
MIKQTEFIQTFNELAAEQWPSAGGKGGTLAQLYQAGYPVPDGFVILPAASDGDELRPTAWAQTQTHLKRLRQGSADAAFAVRSSALSEDSAQASFAGEFETVLDVRGDETIREAIRTVRRSRHSERVRAYSEAKGLDAAHEIAVVVQRLVRADISGVLFTADPVTGSRTHMTGNFVYGLGEKLVSGEIEPHTFTLERPKGRYSGPPDLKRFARRLHKLGRRLEKELDCPQDIEWAIAGRKLYLLQSRPITTLMGFDPVTGEFNDSLTGDYVWSCVNIGEAMSEVMTPYTWSVVRRTFDQLNILPGYHSAGNIGGRAYQNVTVMASMFHALGRNIKDLSKEMGGVRDEYLETMDQYVIPLPEATLFAVLPNAIQMRKKQTEGLKNLAAFLSENPGWCRTTCQRIQAAQTKEKLALVAKDDFAPRSRWAFWKAMATAWRYGELVGRLRNDLIELVGATDADALLSNVSVHDELLASLGPVVGLSKVFHGEMSREAYLEQWGHRGTFEVEVSIPRPFEDPGWLDRQLETFARSPVDVEGLLEARRAEFDAAWERFKDRYPRKAKSVRRRLDQAAEAARMREAVRSEFVRFTWVGRVWALRIGELTGIGEGVFFLTYDELLDLLAGKDAPVAYIPARRRTYERYKALPPYPLIIRGRFNPFQWAEDPNRRDDVFDSHGLLPKIALKAPRENVILGMPGSAGRVEGTVRRLDDPEDGDELKPGEILVAAQTNIGWTFLFPRAAAIVTDVGAPLSHAAIVARELGIPAVVNCGDATARLRNGDWVLVDGAQGVIEILETDGTRPGPVATLGGHDPTTGQWNDSLTGDFLWSNVNFGEAMPDVMPPLTWSVVFQLRFGEWNFVPGHHALGNIGGRPYFNLSVLASIFHAMGKSGQDALKMVEGTMYTRLPQGVEIPVIPLSKRSLLSILPNLMQMQIKEKRAVRGLPAYLATNSDWCKRMRQQIKEASVKDALVSLWREEIEPHITRYFWAVLGSADHHNSYVTPLRHKLAALVGPDDADALLSSVSGHDELLASLGPVVGLAKVGRGEMDRAAYMEQYGHRGPHECELSIPRLAEAPAQLDQQLAQFAKSLGDVEALLAKQRAAFDRAWERLQAQHPRKAKSMRRRIDEAASRARIRESVRSEFARDLGVVRAFALRAGHLTGLGDGVFFLYLDELLDLLSGQDTATEHIAARQETHARYKALPPYPTVIRGHFDPFHWAADPNRRSDIYDAHPSPPTSESADGGDTITGFAGAAGHVEGLVRRLDDAEQGHQLQPGEILVAPTTNIGWTPIFPRAAAIITDVGAPLSHAAIVARELGIPAVVGCGNATMRLHTGDRVRVDGGRGTVEILRDV